MDTTERSNGQRHPGEARTGGPAPEAVDEQIAPEAVDEQIASLLVGLDATGEADPGPSGQRRDTAVSAPGVAGSRALEPPTSRPRATPRRERRFGRALRERFNRFFFALSAIVLGLAIGVLTVRLLNA